jgi:hypothetical protein
MCRTTLLGQLVFCVTLGTTVPLPLPPIFSLSITNQRRLTSYYANVRIMDEARQIDRLEVRCPGGRSFDDAETYLRHMRSSEMHWGEECHMYTSKLRSKGYHRYGWNFN